MEMTPPPDLVSALLSAAGLAGRPQAVVSLGESTNRVWALTLGDHRYVLRQRLDGSAASVRKEAYLSGLLAARDVPAPRVLAAATGEHVAALSTYVEGVGLDQALGSLTRHELASAWRSVGDVLRGVHEIGLGTAGEIVGDRIKSFAGGWAAWSTGHLADDLVWLRDRVADGIPISAARIDRFADLARDALADAPVRLIHNDALPQNILVAPGADGWRCTGVLDWEFARAGDPRWDLATLDLRPAHLVPEAFYEGYGTHPREPHATIYEVLALAWKTRAQLEGRGDWSWTPLAARLAYLRDLAEHLARI
jgi:hygromycin-B 7''-O-kinase